MTEEFPAEWGERRRRREEERLRREGQVDPTGEAASPPSRRELRRREATDSTPVAPDSPIGGLGPSRPVSPVRHAEPSAAPVRPVVPPAPQEAAPQGARRSTHQAPATPVDGGRGVTWSTTAGRGDVPTTQTVRAAIPTGTPVRRAAGTPKAPTRRQLREPTDEAPQVGISPPPVTGGVRRLGPDGRLSPVEPTVPADLPSPAQRSAALRAQAERARIEREQVAQDRVRAAQQRAARERIERERQEQSRRERDASGAIEHRMPENGLAEAARVEAARVEAERAEAERAEAARVEAERAEAARAALAAQEEADRLAHEQAERQAQDAERAARERATSASRMATRSQWERTLEPDATPPESTGPEREVAAPIAVVVPGGAPGPVPDEAELEPVRGRIARLRADRVAQETQARERILAAERVGKTAETQQDAVGVSLDDAATTDAATTTDGTPFVARLGAAAQEAPVVPLWPSITGETITVSAESTRPVRRTRRGFGDDEELAVLDAHPDEDEELDEAEAAHTHPYSWIHWVALVLVAFVLGVIIMMVINRDAASGTSNASPVAAVVATVPGTA